MNIAEKDFLEFGNAKQPSMTNPRKQTFTKAFRPTPLSPIRKKEKIKKNTFAVEISQGSHKQGTFRKPIFRKMCA